MIIELRQSIYYRNGRPNDKSARGDETPIVVSFPIVLESSTTKSLTAFLTTTLIERAALNRQYCLKWTQNNPMKMFRQVPIANKLLLTLN